MNRDFNEIMKKSISILFASILLIMSLTLSGCSGKTHGLSKENPTPVTVWHYYNGAAASKFDELVAEFNNTVGLESGIAVTARSMGTISGLEAALQDAADKKVGAQKMPNIFQCYPDTAVSLGERIGLVDFNEYVTEDEKLAYVRQFLDAGCIGEDKAWKIFPIARSTEVLMLNKTDWDKFARAENIDVSSLSTWEGLAQTAESYYKWSGGKAFFGRDSYSNYIIIGSSQLGHEIFKEKDGVISIDFDKSTMRRIWDNFYVPYVHGYYSQKGNFRSDDVKVGEIIALVCSSSASAYFPDSVAGADGKAYPVKCMVLPLPGFEGAPPYAAAQGAGMAVVEASKAEEYASVVFLKWFTQTAQNLEFCTKSGYMPVSLEASQTDIMSEYLDKNSPDKAINDAIMTSFLQTEKYVMYTPAAFANGACTRAVLEQTLLNALTAARNAVDGGASADEYVSDECFDKWYSYTLSELRKYCK